MSETPISPSPADPVMLTKKYDLNETIKSRSLNRCRSPMCFQLFAPSHTCICAHCQRVLLEYESENIKGICAFCQTHWFQRDDGSPYHYCAACKAFHFAGYKWNEKMRCRYFYDLTKSCFEEVCLPSQLNKPRQRSKDRTQKQALVIPEDKAALLPSIVSILSI